MAFDDDTHTEARTPKDRMAIAQAIGVATKNVGEGGGPFGAVLVKDGKVIATGGNRVTLNNDPSAHAEVVAIRAACQELGEFSLAGCTLYSSCEPCPMCLATVLWARLDRVVYAADQQDADRFGFDDERFHQLFRARPLEWTLPKVEQHRHDDALAPFEAWHAADGAVGY